MNQDQIAVQFRSGELARRQIRRDSLMQQFKNLTLRMQNEGMLLEEVLNPDDWEIHKRSMEAIKIQQEMFDKAMNRGYWKRLWLAILGK